MHLQNFTYRISAYHFLVGLVIKDENDWRDGQPQVACYTFAIAIILTIICSDLYAVILLFLF